MGRMGGHWVDARGTAFIAVLVVTPVMGMLLLTRGTNGPAELLPVSNLITYALTLGAGVFVYLHWRMSSVGVGERLLASRHAAWLTVGLVLSSVHGLVQSAPMPTDPTSPGADDPWAVVSQIVVLVLLTGIALIAERADVPCDPALVGGVLGLVVTAAYFAVSAGLTLDTSPTGLSMLNTVAMLAGLLLALVVLQRLEIRLWVRYSLALSTTLLVAAQCVSTMSVRSEALVVAALVTNLVAAALLCTMTQSLLRMTLAEHQEEMTLMRAAFIDLRHGALEDRELIHEVGSTIAGIATATRVMRQGRDLSAARKARLENMLTIELGRLERLLCARAPSVSGPYAVDAVVEPLVVSHQTRGLDVRWTPSGGLLSEGDPDDLAEVVNILLENVARHGGGTATIAVRSDGGFVELEVSDSGPGVEPELRDRIFDSGERSESSPGQGLGLAIARRLATELGGSLDLVDTDGPGATFLVRLGKCEVLDARHVA